MRKNPNQHRRKLQLYQKNEEEEPIVEPWWIHEYIRNPTQTVVATYRGCQATDSDQVQSQVEILAIASLEALEEQPPVKESRSGDFFKEKSWIAQRRFFGFRRGIQRGTSRQGGQCVSQFNNYALSALMQARMQVAVPSCAPESTTNKLI